MLDGQCLERRLLSPVEPKGLEKVYYYYYYYYYCIVIVFCFLCCCFCCYFPHWKRSPHIVPFLTFVNYFLLFFLFPPFKAIVQECLELGATVFFVARSEETVKEKEKAWREEVCLKRREREREREKEG